MTTMDAFLKRSIEFLRDDPGLHQAAVRLFNAWAEHREAEAAYRRSKTK